MMEHKLTFFINGKKIVDDNVDPSCTLLSYLRNKLRLCGTKLGCAEGGCGSCTVMVSQYDREHNKVRHKPINACLAPVCSMHGLAVTTVEGIGSTRTKLHPVQERIAKAHGTQCGFCTPGIVMSMYTLLRITRKPSIANLETAFQGNLCRCTGYRPIIEGYKTFTENWEIMQNNCNSDVCAMGKDCCKFNNEHVEEELVNKSEFLPYDATQEPIFPPELKLDDVLDKQSLKFCHENVTWYRPTTLLDLLNLKNKFPGAKIVVGNTEIGIEVKFKNCVYPTLISTTHIRELNEIQIVADGITVGASVTLDRMESYLLKLSKILPVHKTQIFAAILKMLPYFAGKQIRSVASMGGNIMTGSPISDLSPILMSARAVLNIESVHESRKLQLNEHFFVGYRKNAMQPNEILKSIFIPFSIENQYFVFYKQSRRQHDDIAIVNSAISVIIDPKDHAVKAIDLAFGGLAPTTVLALKTKQAIQGMKWCRENLDKCYSILLEELQLASDAPGGMTHYRRSLVVSLFHKSFLEISSKIMFFNGVNDLVEPSELSSISKFKTDSLKSAQYFQIRPETQHRDDFVGRPIVHQSAFKHATGEAIYCDDIPKFEKEAYMSLVLSTCAHAKIISIDATDALSMKGVIGFLSRDNSEIIKFGIVTSDEEVFATEKVTCQGQVIGAVVAEDALIAKKAAQRVRVNYEPLPPLISIEDAIDSHSYYSGSPQIHERGNITEAFKSAEHIVEGDCRTGYQEHFYMEPQNVIAVPKYEDGEMEIYCCSQSPSDVQFKVAKMLDIPLNRVVVKVKRIGGGFGGKESRILMIILPIAWAARRFNRPVRLVLDRDEDMIMTGGRNPFLMKYKVGFDNSGRIVATYFKLYCNGGNSLDLSHSIVEHAMIACENSYVIPNIGIEGYVCKTNLPSNTAFRGFGAPQAVMLAEYMIRHVAEYLGKPAAEVQELNMFREGDLTTYNQPLIDCTVRRCWDECMNSANFSGKSQEIQKFNKANRWRKRGIAAVPISYGICFPLTFMNQAGALVMIYRDGSVLISHAGTEMGQGLHTKMIQVTSRALGIPISKIHISETATDKVPNTTPTAASVSSDLNGMAILDACTELNKRLQPIKAANPNDIWEQWISKAYCERISLAATGFYKTPDIGYDLTTMTGVLHNYMVYGACVTEVEIDCMTGEHQVLRTDIVMDVGDSLNPAIDIGQIEGAFMQGYGFYTMEEMIYSPTGTIFTRGPSTYKIPAFGDIPRIFNVSLLKGSSNPRAVYSSKAVGEPPLLSSCSVLFAIREAIKAAREEEGFTEFFKIDAPATCAKIRLACQDKFVKMTEEPITDSPKWNVIP